MSSYTDVKNLIISNIKANGQREITGPILQDVLLNMLENSSEADAANKEYVDNKINDIPVEKGSGYQAMVQKVEGVTASGQYASAFGINTKAPGDSAHVEGWQSESRGVASHAEGVDTIASGNASHAEGQKTKAINKAEHAEGRYNVSIKDKTIHTVGIGAGTSDTDRKNAHEIHLDGKHYIYGIGGYDGTNSQTEGIKTVQEVAEDVKKKLDNCVDLTSEQTITAVKTFSAGISMNNTRIRKVKVPTNKDDAANKGYVDESVLAKPDIFILSSDRTMYEAVDAINKKMFIVIKSPRQIFEDYGYLFADYACIWSDGSPVFLFHYIDNRGVYELRYYYDVMDGKWGISQREYTIPDYDYLVRLSGKQTITGEKTFSAGIDLNGTRISKVGSPVNTDDAANKEYVDTKIDDIPVAKSSGPNSMYQKGGSNTASGTFSSAFGVHTEATGEASYTEGDHTIASGRASHAEGTQTQATNDSAHAEGYKTVASRYQSHAEGNQTSADGVCSHTEGFKTQTTNKGEHAEGLSNISIEGKTVHTVGIGSAEDNVEDRKNAEEIHLNGDKYVYGIGGYNGTNPETAKTVQEVVEEVDTKIGGLETKTSKIEGDVIKFSGLNFCNLFGAKTSSDVKSSLYYPGYYPGDEEIDDLTYYSGLISYLRNTFNTKHLDTVQFYAIEDMVEEHYKYYGYFFDIEPPEIILYNTGGKYYDFIKITFLESTDDEGIPNGYILDSVSTFSFPMEVIKNKVSSLETKNTELTNTITELEPRVTNAVQIKYTDLKSLRDAGKLVPGTQYRITDYTCTTTQTGTKSAGHVFDIIVTADDESTLNEVARAVKHDGDTYFANNDLNAWKIWYCFDNDTTRFVWADKTNGKGVIYRMIDEFGNDCPYDFKNIQFKHPKDTTTYPYYYYTFASGNAETNTDYSLSITHNCYSNTIREYMDGAKRKLNCIFFIGNNCYSNTFENDCYNNVLWDYCWHNTFGNNCYNNTFGSYYFWNTFGNDCYKNTFENYCHGNIFGNSCCYNIFGNDCCYNIFGNDCNSIKFASNASATTKYNYYQYNHFGDGCRYIVFTGAETASSSSQVQNYKFAQGLQGTDSAYLTIDGVRNLSYETKVAKNSNGDLKIYCEADIIL